MKSLFQVNLGGILKVLSDNLYSHKEVFVRELLQNAVDAIKARGHKEQFEAHIKIDYYDADNHRGLVISDNGIGLTEDEVNEFLSKIGASSKSQQALEETRNDFIGQFGIGLLSCFMVSDEIVVHSRSVKADYMVKWVGNIDGTYQTETIEDTDREAGTQVVLKLRNNVDFDRDKLIMLLNLYGKYLGIPIEVEVNGQYLTSIQGTFPWDNKTGSDQALNLGREVFQENFSNFLYIRDSSGKTKGIAYIMPHPTHFGSTQSNRVYIKNMFITAHAQHLLPEWAFFVRVIINSENLSPTASREDIYHNDAYENVREDLGNAIKEYLINLSKSSPQSLERIIKVHGHALKYMSLSDPEFLGFIANWFTFSTTEGVLTLQEIKKRVQTVFYISDVDEFRQIVPIAKAQNKLVINAGYVYDSQILEALSHIDKGHLYQVIDTEYFGNILKSLSIEVFDRHKSRLDTLQDYLLKFDCELEIRQFVPDNIPAIFHLSERKMMARDIEQIKNDSNDLWAGISGAVFEPTVSFRSKLFLNFNNSIVQKLLRKPQEKMERPLVETLYINAMLMGHYPLNQQELDAMNENLTYILDQSF